MKAKKGIGQPQGRPVDPAYKPEFMIRVQQVGDQMPGDPLPGETHWEWSGQADSIKDALQKAREMYPRSR